MKINCPLSVKGILINLRTIKQNVAKIGSKNVANKRNILITEASIFKVQLVLIDGFKVDIYRVCGVNEFILNFRF
jgi:hypothetical protein